MKSSTIFLFILFIALEVQASTLETIEWELSSSREGIMVFKPVSYKHPSGLVPLRFKATIKYNISKVLTVLDDSNRKPEWMPSVKEIVVLEVPNKMEKIVYYRYKTPWPLNERDFIVHNFGSFDSKSKTVTVRIKSVEHKSDPRPSDVVRGVSYDGFSRIKYIDDKTTEVEMSFLNDFKGSIPTFVVNYVQAKWPYKFMANLREQLAKKDIKINPAYILKGRTSLK